MPRSVEMVFEAWEMVLMDDLSLTMWQPLVIEAVEFRLDNKRTAKKATTEISHLFRNLQSSGAVTLEDVTPSMVHD